MTQPSEDRAAFEAWFAEHVKSPALDANDCDELRERQWLAWQASRTPSLDTAADYVRGLGDAAKVCDKIRDGYGPPVSFDISYGVADECATAIRSLAPKPTVER